MVAFVAAPVLFMALLLTTRPLDALGLRRPVPRMFQAAAFLAVLLLLPLAELTLYVLHQFPGVVDLLAEHNLLMSELKTPQNSTQSTSALAVLPQYLVALALLPAICEEIAFRGLILSGLRQRFHAGGAIVLSSLLFALYHLNVFQFVPAFVLGLVLGVLAVRSRSILPGMLFHLLHNGMLLSLALLQTHGLSGEGGPGSASLRAGVAAVSALGAAAILWRLARRSETSRPGVSEGVGEKGVGSLLPSVPVSKGS
jgi:sodium transport system permease protein